MAGIWKSPEMTSPPSPSIDWVPLPEVKVEDSPKSCYFNGEEDTSSHRLYSHSSPILGGGGQMNITPLTILSCNTSTGQPISTKTMHSNNVSSETKTSATIDPSSLDPTHLDELWKRFLEIVVLPRCNPSGCGCNCHLSLYPGKTTTAENNPLLKPNDITKPLFHSEQSHAESTTTTPPQFHYHASGGVSFNAHGHNATTPSQRTRSSTESEPVVDTPTVPNESSTTLERLTLQEACHLLKKGFIANSRRRQDTIKNKIRARHRFPRQPTAKPHLPPPPSAVHSKGHVPLIEPSQRPKLSFKDMYHQSKRKWDNLPEIREQVAKEHRMREASTNRLRARLYHKVRVGGTGPSPLYERAIIAGSAG